MQRTTERNVTTRAWAAGATLQGIDQPQSGVITEIRVRANITATLTATAVADATKRVLDGLQIVGDNITFLGLTGNVALGILLSLLNQADHKVPGLHANTDVGATGFNHSFMFHPGSMPGNRFDMSAVIPAKKLSNIQAIINAPAAAVTDAAGNITAGTYSIEVDHVKNVPISRGMMMPAGFVQVWNQDANYASFGKEIDIPAGSYLRRIVILSLDNTAVTPLRADDEIGGVKLFLPKASRTVIESNWEDLKYATARRYGIVGDSEPTVLGAIATTRPGYNGAMHMPAGFAIIDLRDYVDPSENPLGPLYGLNLVGKQQGDAKLGLTITNRAAGDATIIYWDLVQPIPQSMWEV